MTQGEKMVWAAAFLQKLGNVDEPSEWEVQPRDKEGKPQPLKSLTVQAVEFANKAVGAMWHARDKMIDEKRKKTFEWERLIDMLKD